MGVVLVDDDIERFVTDGFIRLERPFHPDLAARCVDELWSMLPIDRDDPTGWTKPVIRISGSTHPDLVAAINTPRLVGAINDVLGGPDQWQPRLHGYGTFPVRFPSAADPGDCGRHIDGSFGEPPWYRVNLASQGRALLLLMLFSEVTDRDAPTRIKAGSHRDVARALVDQRSDGIVFDVNTHAPAALDHETVLAVGSAGDVYICHPFLVHAASWPHRGDQPRFVGQPCIHHPQGEWLGRFDYQDLATDSPVKRAVREAIEQA